MVEPQVREAPIRQQPQVTEDRLYSPEAVAEAVEVTRLSPQQFPRVREESLDLTLPVVVALLEPMEALARREEMDPKVLTLTAPGVALAVVAVALRPLQTLPVAMVVMEDTAVAAAAGAVSALTPGSVEMAGLAAAASA